jgi:hypothetical protein
VKIDDKRRIYNDAKPLGMRVATSMTPSWSDQDFEALRATATQLRMDAPDLLTVLVSESHTLEPSARNPADPNAWPIAVGLNQITRSAAAASGLIAQETTRGSNFGAWCDFADKTLASTPGQQMPILAAYYGASQWTRAGKPWPDAVKIYAFNAGGGDETKPVDDTTVIYAAGSPGYEGNKALDLDGSGEITGKDLRIAVDYHQRSPLFHAALLRLAAPSARAGYVQGYKDGQVRLAPAPILASGLDGDFYRLGYEDGYALGLRAPSGSTTTLPDWLRF